MGVEQVLQLAEHQQGDFCRWNLKLFSFSIFFSRKNVSLFDFLEVKNNQKKVLLFNIDIFLVFLQWATLSFEEGQFKEMGPFIHPWETENL